MLEGMGREQMRAADADRQQVADQLRLALEEGRLDLAEYDERLRDAYGAKTYGDLDRLLNDLPQAAAVVPAAPAPVPAAPAGGESRAWLGHVWGAWTKAAAFFTIIWALGWVFGGDPVFYWPAWIVGPWALVLLLRTAGGLASGEPRKHALEAEHRQRLRAHRLERKMLYRQAIANGQLPVNPSKQERKAFIADAIDRGDLPPKPRKPTIDD